MCIQPCDKRLGLYSSFNVPSDDESSHPDDIYTESIYGVFVLGQPNTIRSNISTSYQVMPVGYNVY